MDSKFAEDSIISGNWRINKSAKRINIKIGQAPKFSLLYEIGAKGPKRTFVGLHYDANFNGTKDASDPLLAFYKVRNKALNQILSKDEPKGGFKINANTGAYKLSFAGNDVAFGEMFYPALVAYLSGEEPPLPRQIDNCIHGNELNCAALSIF